MNKNNIFIKFMTCQLNLKRQSYMIIKRINRQKY